MKRQQWLYGAVIGAAVFMQQGWAEPAAPRSYVDGAVVVEQLRSVLQAEGFSPITHIAVDANDDGEVLLKGVAASDAEAARAVELAKKIKGVVGVRSEIAVKRLQ